MKLIKIFSIISFLCFSISFSQNHYTFTYEYVFKIDSLERKNVNKEIMNLDIIEGNSSIFYSYDKFVRDSLINLEFKKSQNTFSNSVNLSNITKTSKVSDIIYKDYIKNEKNLYLNLNGNAYEIADKRQLKWKILNEKKEIQNYMCQKAITSFGNRKWSAWFTSDLPFQDGPYKFSGLPGLIVYLEDNKGDHIYKLIGINKNNLKDLSINKSNYLKITENQFKKIWKNYIADPISEFKKSVYSSEGKIKMVKDGKVLSQQEMIKYKEDQEKEKLKHINNFIDLALYK